MRYMLNAFEYSNVVNGRHGLKNTIEHIEIIDPSDIPEQEIKDAKTIMTMVDGRIVYEA